MDFSQEGQRRNNVLSERSQVLLLFVAAVLSAGYLLLRYGDRWAIGGDATRFSDAIFWMAQENSLAPAGHTYGNGYGYQALAVFLIEITGIELGLFQSSLSLILAAWIVVPAWLLYRELTESGETATISVILLLLQSEFLFGILRGTHEKFTRGLMLLSLYLLLRGVRSRNNVVQVAGIVLAFYLCAYAMMAYNSLFATSFFGSLVLALGLIWVACRSTLSSATDAIAPYARRMLYASFTVLVLTFIFMFYIYAPASWQIILFQRMLDTVAALFLDLDIGQSVNPYEGISSGWISLPAYLILSVANWLIIGVSGLIWVWTTWRLVTKRRLEELQLLLWAFYSAFAFLGAVSVVADLSGILAANLQHRLFPSFAMFATPLVARWFVDRWQTKGNRYRQLAGIPLAILLLSALFVASVAKAGNEPLFSNYWRFYSPAEIRALYWTERRLPNRPIWTAFDARLLGAYSVERGGQVSLKLLDKALVEPGTRDFIVSNLNRAHSVRIRQRLPIMADDTVTYDNGIAQVYHRRPSTPYQR